MKQIDRKNHPARSATAAGRLILATHGIHEAHRSRLHHPPICQSLVLLDFGIRTLKNVLPEASDFRRQFDR
jgi:hypothetical protein